MAEIGSVIDGKYEILKEIGRGGMSTVYLAMDTHLNKQWAVKEVRKTGKGKNDEIIENSFLAEANLMKKLDHHSLPRIVDIIDNGITIYVVMDYIEGESLDKVLKEFGAQPEEKVIEWAMQIADALHYLHTRKPPIIYRDMKPANIMLKPEGNIKIIDFGIAREYKDQNQADTVVLGTRGYASPEHYNGQTDARSDIYTLGKTMHQLLTCVDPRNGEAYRSVREWNHELSEGIEYVIDKCVESSPEHRYQNCMDLIYDLEHLDEITPWFRRIQLRKLIAFLSAVGISILSAVAGLVLNMSATNMNNQDYDVNIASSDPSKYYTAVDIYPERADAYNMLIEYYKSHDATNDQITKVGNTIEANMDVLDVTQPEIADMYYDMGKLYFSDYEGSFKSRAVSAQNFFKTATDTAAIYDKKEIAKCYNSICEFMTRQSTTSEHALQDYTDLFDKIEQAVQTVEKATDSEANYDKISLYYVTMLLINDQAEFMAGVKFDRQEAVTLMEELEQKVNGITSTLPYVNNLKEEIQTNYESFLANINAKYSEVEKRQQGGR